MRDYEAQLTADMTVGERDYPIVKSMGKLITAVTKELGEEGAIKGSASSNRIGRHTATGIWIGAGGSELSLAIHLDNGAQLPLFLRQISNGRLDLVIDGDVPIQATLDDPLDDGHIYHVVSVVMSAWRKRAH